MPKAFGNGWLSDVRARSTFQVLKDYPGTASILIYFETENGVKGNLEIQTEEAINKLEDCCVVALKLLKKAKEI